MVIAVVGQNAKNKKKPTTASPQEVLEDVFPEIESQEEEKVMPQAQPVAPVIKKASIRKHPIPQPQAPAQRKEISKPKKKIDLSHQAEAKRAFIYSEIFNRKY